MLSKLNIEFDNKIVESNIERLTNQIWKLIPMYENNENWHNQLNSVLIEIIGLNELFSFSQKYLILLSKLKGLATTETEFFDFRRTVFESITLLREVYKDATKN